MPSDRLDDLERLGKLLGEGRITEADYDRLKNEILQAESKRSYNTSAIIGSTIIVMIFFGLGVGLFQLNDNQQTKRAIYEQAFLPYETLAAEYRDCFDVEMPRIQPPLHSFNEAVAICGPVPDLPPEMPAWPWSIGLEEPSSPLFKTIDLKP